jgi:hypothetical protein
MSLPQTWTIGISWRDPADDDRPSFRIAGSATWTEEQAHEAAQLLGAAPALLHAVGAALAYLVDAPSRHKINRQAAAALLRSAYRQARGEPIPEENA